MICRTFARSVALLLALSVSMGALAATPVPGDSVYRLQMPLTTQAGEQRTLTLYRGAPLLVSMFYASCGSVCPTLIKTIQHAEQSLPPESRARLRVLLVSFDSEHDTAEVLSALAVQHQVDTTRWTLARAPSADVRKLAALLGIQYRQLPDGSFSHSTLVALVDGEGRVRARSSQPLGRDESFARQLQAVIAASRP